MASIWSHITLPRASQKALKTKLLHLFLFHIYQSYFHPKKKLDGHSIQLIEFQLTSQTDLPQHHHTTNGLPPHLLLDLIKAFDMSGPNFINILNTVNPDLIVYDLFQSWLPPLAAFLQIPAVHFQVVGAVTTSAFYRFVVDTSIPVPSSSIFLHDDTEVRKTDERDYESSLGENSGKVYLTNITVGSAKQSSDIILVRSIREIEEKYIEYLSLLMDKKIVPTGPLVQANTSAAVQIEDENDQLIMEWLSKKDESSTVFVSFGSECYLSDSRIRELAHGLELSNVNFIWVIRFPVGEEMCNIEDVLPEGFTDRVKDRGMIVKGWAPQARILGHGGIGGFVSHCGCGVL